MEHQYVNISPGQTLTPIRVRLNSNCSTLTLSDILYPGNTSTGNNPGADGLPPGISFNSTGYQNGQLTITINGTLSNQATGTYPWGFVYDNSYSLPPTPQDASPIQAATTSITIQGIITVVASSNTYSSTNNSGIYFENGTCKCPNATVGETATISGTTYTVVDNSTIQGEVDNGNVNLCTTLVTDMTGLFRGKSDFNTNINFWDTSNVTDITNLFYEASSFNQDLNKWDTSSVVSMINVFLRANSFNGDISTWDTSNVTNMSGFAIWTQNFNSDISNWNVSNVTSLRNTFLDARSFNQDISGWDVSNVTDMNSTFTGASVFNQNISNWNLSSVTDMSRLFTNASAFNQDIGQWDVSNVSDMWQMFSGATNFNQDLSGWCVSNISSEPENFSLNSALTNENKPVWGTCPSDDTTPPVITLNGSSTIQLTVGDSWTDPGATATDDTDGDITSSITVSGTVDTSTVGTYTLVYYVADAASNTASLTRTVVVNPAATSSIYFENGTCKCPDATVGDSATIDGVVYTVVDNSTFQNQVDNGNVNLCTTFVTNMSQAFTNKSNFNSNISFWDTSNVTNMSECFRCKCV